MFNPDDLQTFLAIAEEGNLTRASHRRGLSQPAVSQSLVRLESELGTKLCHRDPRGVTLTTEGTLLLVEVRNLVESWSRLKSMGARASEQMTGTLTIGCHVSVAQYSLPLFLPHLRRDFPGLELRLSHGLSRDVTRLVIDRAVDLGIVVNPLASPDLVIKPLATDIVEFWTKGDGRNRKTMICDPSLHQTQVLLRKSRRKGLDRWPRIESSSLEVVRQLIHAELGIGILPRRVALAIPQLRLQQVSDSPSYTDHICAVYRFDTRNRAVLQKAVEYVEKGFQTV